MGKGLGTEPGAPLSLRAFPALHHAAFMTPSFWNPALQSDSGSPVGGQAWKSGQLESERPGFKAAAPDQQAFPRATSWAVRGSESTWLVGLNAVTTVLRRMGLVPKGCL